MQEVTIRLRFNRECLGNIKRKHGRQVLWEMPRDGNEQVMFLPSWWKGSLRYAAKVLGKHHREAAAVAWDPIIDGCVSRWKRTIQPSDEDEGGKKRRLGFAMHEAFKPGDVIGVNAVLPHGLGPDEFSELLQVVGTYKGISPFQSSTENYGTFEVTSVMPTIRARKSVPKPEEATVED